MWRKFFVEFFFILYGKDSKVKPQESISGTTKSWQLNKKKKLLFLQSKGSLFLWTSHIIRKKIYFIYFSHKKCVIKIPFLSSSQFTVVIPSNIYFHSICWFYRVLLIINRVFIIKIMFGLFFFVCLLFFG